MDEPLPVATVPLSSSANGGVALSVAVVAPPEMNRGDASAQNATQSSGNQGRSLTAHSWAKPRIVPANDQQTAAQETPADDAEPKAKKRHSRIAMRMAFTMGSSSDSDPSDVAQRLPTFKERFAAFSAMTTAHGFASAMDTRYPRVCRFVIWMLFTVAGLAVFSWTCAQQYSDVGQYPVNIESNITSSPIMQLPQITVCTFAESTVWADPNDLITSFVLDCYINRMQGSNFSCLNTPTAQYWRVSNSTWNNPDSYTVCMELFGIGSPAPPEDSVFTSAGFKNSLEIVLDLANGDPYRSQGDAFADGVQVAVQPRTQYSLPLTGFTAAPGLNTVAAISKRTFTRQNLPYNPDTKGCSEDPRMTMEICQQMCDSFRNYAQFVQEGYTDYQYYISNDTAMGYVCPEMCQPSCYQEEYTVQTSLRSQTNYFASYYCNVEPLSSGLCLNDTQASTADDFVCVTDSEGNCEPDPAQYAKRILSLTIYPSTLSVVNSNEVPKYQAWSIISGIGGNLGLLLGFSLLTVFEWLEFFMCGTCLYRYYAGMLRSKPWSE